MKNLNKKWMYVILAGLLIIAVVLTIIIGKKGGIPVALPAPLESLESPAVKEFQKKIKDAKAQQAATNEAKDSLVISEVSKKYTNTNPGYVVEYPSNFTINAEHIYTAFGPGKGILGVAFIIPKEIIKGTNLSSDSYISFEHFNRTDCVAKDFLYGVSLADETVVTTGGTTYRMAHTTEGAAGNIYDETVYVDNHCNAIRYFIHSTNIDNYDPDTIQEFNRADLIKVFDEIRNNYYTL